MPVLVLKEVTLHSCFDIGCRVFHDCIEGVQSVTFLTSSYCCKLMKFTSYSFKVSVACFLKMSNP